MVYMYQQDEPVPVHQNQPELERKVGGWAPAFLLLANQALATFAFFGVGVNMVLFLTRVIVKPAGCGDGVKECMPTSLKGSMMFYTSIYMVALGYGGHQPTLATLGADQFDESDPKHKEKGSKGAFFAYFYAALNIGSLFSNSILVYYEDIGFWTMGFCVSMASAIIALLSFFCGSFHYRYVKASGNPLPRVAQVFVAACRKRGVRIVDEKQLYESDLSGPQDQWRLCTVTQVEEAKCVIRMLPIWLCTIIYSVIFTQMASLFVEQGAVMNSYIGNFHLPAASMSIFDILSVLVCTLIYRKVLVPLAGKLSGNPKGLTELQRMGIGLIIGLLSMIAAGVTEVERLKQSIPEKHSSSMSIFWQVPQYVLVGASEVFMYVGQLEFFNSQAPDGIKSFGSSLCMASISLGNYVSSLLVHMVMSITARGDDVGWIPEDLNDGHMDRFYFLIAILTIFDFVLYVYCAKKYKCISVEEDANGPKKGEA
ncbi:Major facilitator superfamily domain, general substrate transporter [Cynara cardunculus var. scolymus]|uniref:Major facilitator superfamily domain, general substrate transporter n=1 Tax=Cynara cardunculus var. scolymus TaxID=59895 RepID=A0A103XHH6_CYNCS|nr:Major facilitator superfamily domain, general substrate transporter [Cynara cardunculus var. scolymus]